MDDSNKTLAQLLAERNMTRDEIGRYKHLVLMAARWAKRSEQWRKAWHPIRTMAIEYQKRATADLAAIEKEIAKKQKTLL